MAASDRLSAGKASEDIVVEMSADSSQPRDVDEAVEIAQLIEHERPNLWTKRMFRLYGILLLGYMCIILQGYDGSLMGAINDMVCVPSFMRSFPIHGASLTICSTAAISKIFWNVRLFPPLMPILILTSQEIRWFINRSRLRHLQHRLSQLFALRRPGQRLPRSSHRHLSGLRPRHRRNMHPSTSRQPRHVPRRPLRNRRWSGLHQRLRADVRR